MTFDYLEDIRMLRQVKQQFGKRLETESMLASMYVARKKLIIDHFCLYCRKIKNVFYMHIAYYAYSALHYIAVQCSAVQ